MTENGNVIKFPQPERIECPACEDKDVTTTMETETFTYGEGAEAVELTVRVPVRTCTSCGFQFTDDIAEEIRHEAVCRYLDIRFEYAIASELNLSLPVIDHPGGWAPAMSRSLGATTYVNPIGGRSLFRRADFDAAGVALQFLDFRNYVYATAPYRYVDALSILDVMMWNDPAAIREAIATRSRIIDSRECPETNRSAQ